MKMKNKNYGKNSSLSRRIFLASGALSAVGLSSAVCMAKSAHAANSASGGNGEYMVLNPQGIRQERERIPLSPSLKDLKGKTVYFVCQDKPVQTRELANRLRKRIPETEVIFRMKQGWVGSDDTELIEELKHKANAMVYGTAIGGGSGKYAVGWISELEKLGIPSVYVVGEALVQDVEASSSMFGMPSMRTAITPLVPEEKVTEDISDEKYDAVISAIIKALTNPLTEEEKKTGKMFTEKLPRIAMSGTLDEVQDYFYRQGWTDGLPVIPPTEEKVREMLRRTSHAPDKVVTSVMHPEELTVTVEKTAIVGVMAGCRPEYMPALLAIVETYGNPAFTHAARSESSFSIMTFFNGPIRHEMKMNPSTNALGPGNQANASIGRFLSLAAIALGGSRPIVNNMSALGNPTRYSLCFPEYEEESPFEPYHVSRGFDRKESVVSMAAGGWCRSSILGDLDRIAATVAGFSLDMGGIVLMDPDAARLYQSKSMSKQDIEQYIQRTAIPQRRDPSPRWFRLDFLPTVGGAYNDPLKDPRCAVKLVIVGGKTILPNAQVWEYGQPISTSVDKWR
ncbi:MAG: hypothetical protein JXA73_25905 [Acidobacteria bacterium]|nr:hypothetical protein [Acidobacteriota bacterium]